MSYKL